MNVLVLIPTLGLADVTATLLSLQFLPMRYRVQLVEDRGLGKAVNAAIDQRATGQDVLLIDDDAVILPQTFSDWANYIPHGDIFGFKLMKPDNTIQHAGGMVMQWGAEEPTLVHYAAQQGPLAARKPRYACWVSMSMMYIRSDVLDAGVRFPEWEGTQYEAPAFCFDAWHRGFRSLYVPNPVWHHGGMTKSKLGNMEQMVQKHKQCFEVKYNINDHKQMCWACGAKKW